MSTLGNILLLSFLGSILGLTGGLVFLINNRLARYLSKYAIPFAAGVLITVSITHLIPEAVEGVGDNAYLVVLGGLLFAFFFEQFFARLHHHEDGHKHPKSSAPLIVFGDTIHNFIDGVAIAASYMVSPTSGVVVAIATFLHETPHEVGDFGILISSGWAKKKTFMVNLYSACATFVGALVTYFWVGEIQGVVGNLLAVSAGVFLYLGATDFLPRVGDDRGPAAKKKLGVLLLGVVLVLLLGLFLPHE